MSMLLQARGLSAVRKSAAAGTVFFPSNSGLVAAGTNTDPGQGSLILGTIVNATAAGVVAKSVRFWMPTAGVGQLLTGYLFAGTSGTTILAFSANAVAVSGFNELVFTTPYNLVNGTLVTACIFIQPVTGDSTQKVSYPANSAVLATDRAVAPMKTTFPGSIYNYNSLALNGGTDSGTSQAWYGVDLGIAA